MTARLELDYTSVEELEEKFKQLPDNVEIVINNYLHRQGIDITTRHITSELPVSKPRKPKRHAKFSRWSKDEKDNLSFVINTRGGAANRRGSFGYLVFPNEGRGPRNPLEQRFMEEGLDSSTPEIIEDLLEEVITKIEEGLS
ncbi:hypothetical protein [Evansella clarkii]|uniref:hypothetical protein n=1 Tax=Evansella clarkii TaxID=79879 RepID=UPI000B43C309|nr:hypothetical protein [Evansella clarkii]